MIESLLKHSENFREEKSIMKVLAHLNGVTENYNHQAFFEEIMVNWMTHYDKIEDLLTKDNPLSNIYYKNIEPHFDDYLAQNMCEIN